MCFHQFSRYLNQRFYVDQCLGAIQMLFLIQILKKHAENMKKLILIRFWSTQTLVKIYNRQCTCKNCINIETDQNQQFFWFKRKYILQTVLLALAAAVAKPLLPQKAWLMIWTPVNLAAPGIMIQSYPLVDPTPAVPYPQHVLP